MKSELLLKIDEDLKTIQGVVKDFINFEPESEVGNSSEFEEIEDIDDEDKFNENIQSLIFS